MISHAVHFHVSQLEYKHLDGMAKDGYRIEGLTSKLKDTKD